MATLTNKPRKTGIMIHVTEKERDQINQNAMKHGNGNRSDLLRTYGLNPQCPHCGKFRNS